MDFGILGPLQVIHAGVEQRLGGVQRQAVLALLVVAGPELVSRDRLVDELWGERPPASAGHAVEVHISSIRKLLRGAGVDAMLRTSGRGYLLEVDPEQVDARRFARLIRDGQGRLGSDPRQAARLFDQALRLWRATPLPEFKDYEFARVEAERLLELRSVAVEGVMEAKLAAGESSELVAPLAGLVSENPLRERPRRQLMLALYRCGRHAEALETYRQAVVALDEIGLEPSPELRELERAILTHDHALQRSDPRESAPGLAQERAASSSEASRPSPAPLPNPSNVELPGSPLIGRESELERIRSTLAGEAHLLTVTGRGGTGKTRLALAAGVDLLDMFPGGSWFVALADIESPAHFLPAVASRLGVAEAQNGSVLTAIAERLQEAPTLLILDNLEQLRDAAGTIDELLRAAPGARILATSQVPLQLTQEHVLALGPLATESGVRLFVDRAAQHADLTTSDGSLAAVNAICERLDGLPLAIELAAARTVVLAPEELLRRLGDSLGILTSRERDRPARQRSLRATIEWSFALLEPRDAELFATLSLFALTFTLADATALAADDVLDGLDSLVQFSFVRRLAARDGAACFTIAQALREFGREQLVSSGRLEAARAAHARWALARAEAGWEALLSDAPDPSSWTAAIGDDVRLALEFLRPRDPLLHLQLASAYAATTTDPAGLPALAAELDHAIAATATPGPLLARARQYAGEIAGHRGQVEQAVQHLGLARELALEHGPPIIAVMALMSLSYEQLTADPASARALAEQALAESDAAGARRWAVLALAQVDVAEGRVEVEPLLAELLGQVTNVDQRCGLRHLYADCALLREDGSATIERYTTALRESVSAGRQCNPADLDGLAMGLALAGQERQALEVDAIARAFRRELRANRNAVFWEKLRDRHLGPIRTSMVSPLDPAVVTDLIAAGDRALALADASLRMASRTSSTTTG